MNQIFRNPLLKPLLGGGGSKVFQIVAMFGVNLLLARRLGVEEFGLFSVAFSIISLGIVIQQFGFPNYFIKNSARSDGEDARIDAYVVSLVVAVFLSAATLIALVFYFTIIGDAGSFSQKQLFFIFLVSLVGAVTVLSGALLRANGKLLLGQVSDQVIVPTAFCVMIFIYRTELSVDSVVVIYACAHLLGLIASVYLLKMNIQFKQVTSTNCKLVLADYKRVFQMSVFALLLILQTHLPVFVLYAFSGVSEVTYFRVGFLLSLCIALLAFPLNMIAGPAIADAARKNNFIPLYSKLNPLVRLMFVLGIVISIAIYFLTEELISLSFGESYLPAVGVVRILIFSGLVSLFFGPVALVLTMHDQESYVAKAMILGILCYFLLLAIFVPLFGSIAAAWSTLVSTLIWKTLMYVRVTRVVGYDCTILGYDSREKLT